MLVGVSRLGIWLVVKAILNDSTFARTPNQTHRIRRDAASIPETRLCLVLQQRPIKRPEARRVDGLDDDRVPVGLPDGAADRALAAGGDDVKQLVVNLQLVLECPVRVDALSCVIACFMRSDSGASRAPAGWGTS